MLVKKLPVEDTCARRRSSRRCFTFFKKKRPPIGREGEMTHFLIVIMKCDWFAGQELTSQQEKLGFVTAVLLLIVEVGVGSHSFIHLCTLYAFLLTAFTLCIEFS